MARHAKADPSGKRILIVDDDAEIVESMRTVLEARGHEVMVARNGEAGLQQAEREMPDLLVLDMMMPRKSGFVVLERLKDKDAKTRDIPCIMITANEGGRHRAYAEMLGVAEYIRKPFAMDKLLGAVDRLLGLEGAGGESASD